MDAYHHLSFTTFLLIIVIGLAKAADELTTFLLVNRFNIQGEANVISSMFYSYGPIGHIALWALYTGIFASAYLIYLRIGGLCFISGCFSLVVSRVVGEII